jgi:HK97 family phage portal protein
MVSHTGVPVTEESALTLSTVFACARVLGESVAMLPLPTYRKRADGGKERATDHPLYRLLHDAPNPEMTSFEWRETKIVHAALRGNGYSEIEWSKSGRPLALWPLNPAKMEITRAPSPSTGSPSTSSGGGELRYLYTLPDGTVANLPSWRVHHVRGMSGDGIRGYSVVRLAMQAIGLGLGTEEYGARWFGNGARPGLLLKVPGRLSDAAYDRLKKSWNAEHEGLSQAHRVKILEEGLDAMTVERS